MEHVEQVLDLKAVEAQMLDTHKTLEGFIAKSNQEIEATGKASTETKAAVDKLSEQAIEIADRLAELEQKQSKRFDAEPEAKTPGDALVESDEFKTMMQHKRGGARVEFKTAIVNATPAMNTPLVAGQRLAGVVAEPNRALRIRDVMQVGRTTSNLIFFAKENVFTNAAAVVRNTASPVVAAENITKPEAALTFTSDQEAVVTIAHFIPVSKQALSDSAFLASYVNSRLMYGLKLTEDDQLLNGTGVTGYITGLNTGATAYAQADSPQSYSTNLDYIRDAKRQCQTSNYEPDVVILNPKDWSDIELQKETGGLYIVGNPLSSLGNSLWGMRVVISNTQTAGTFTVHASQSAQIWDREDANVEISYEDSTNFQKNMATIRAEERLAFTVYNVLGTVKGTFA